MAEKLNWKVHLPRLFDEIMLNPDCSVLKEPLSITKSILAQVAQRAIELDDEKLNILMLRLTLYSCADPLEPDYNPDILKALEAKLLKQG